MIEIARLLGVCVVTESIEKEVQGSHLWSWDASLGRGSTSPSSRPGCDGSAAASARGEDCRRHATLCRARVAVSRTEPDRFSKARRQPAEPAGRDAAESHFRQRVAGPPLILMMAMGNAYCQKVGYETRLRVAE